MHANRLFNLSLAAATGLLVVSLISPQPAATAPSPIQVIQSGTDHVLRIIKSSLSGEGPALRQRRSEIFDIVDEYFDFDEMAKRALGRPWKDQRREKQQEFVGLFRDLLFNTYVSRIEKAATPSTRIVCDRETVEGEYAVVKTRSVSGNNPDVRIDYRLRSKGADWKVYDVVIEGISLVDNYRQQFASILNSESFDSLLRRLQEKVSAQAK